MYRRVVTTGTAMPSVWAETSRMLPCVGNRGLRERHALLSYCGARFVSLWGNSKVTEWNRAVSEAEKVVGYPTSFLSLRCLLSDEVFKCCDADAQVGWHETSPAEDCKVFIHTH